jgi:hypothetical protein
MRKWEWYLLLSLISCVLFINMFNMYWKRAAGSFGGCTSIVADITNCKRKTDLGRSVLRQSTAAIFQDFGGYRRWQCYVSSPWPGKELSCRITKLPACQSSGSNCVRDIEAQDQTGAYGVCDSSRNYSKRGKTGKLRLSKLQQIIDKHVQCVNALILYTIINKLLFKLIVISCFIYLTARWLWVKGRVGGESIAQELKEC